MSAPAPLVQENPTADLTDTFVFAPDISEIEKFDDQISAGVMTLQAGPGMDFGAISTLRTPDSTGSRPLSEINDDSSDLLILQAPDEPGSGNAASALSDGLLSPLPDIGEATMVLPYDFIA